jgi:peroxiredoxin
MKKLILNLIVLLMVTSAINAVGPYKAGDNVPDFSLKNINGEMYSLSKASDAKGFIVVFSCNTCPVVIKYEERIKDLHKEFSGKGYPVVAINSNDKGVSPGDSYEAMQKAAKAKGFTFEYLYDENQEVARNFGATNTPHVYLLSKNGNELKVEYTGAIDNNADNAANADKKYVADAVNALLAEEEVPVSNTKAIGCTIKWKK